MSVARGEPGFPARAGRWIRVSVGRGLLVAAVFGVLWPLRPRGPLLPLALTAPLSVDRVERLLAAAAWVSVVLLVGLLLVRSLGGGRADRDAPDPRDVGVQGRQPRQVLDRPRAGAVFATAARLTLSAARNGERLGSESADRRPVRRRGGGMLGQGPESAASSETGAVDAIEVLALGPLMIRGVGGRAPIVRAVNAEQGRRALSSHCGLMPASVATTSTGAESSRGPRC